MRPLFFEKIMRPKHILFASEFGAGNGHHVLLRSIEKELRKTWPEHVSRFVLPPHSRTTWTASFADTVFPEELKVIKRQGKNPSRYLVHSLCASLISDPATLRSRIAMWQKEISTFKPDLIIANFAPSLAMTTAGKVPCFVVGDGYTIPPPELKNCVSNNDIVELQDAAIEMEWLEKLNKVLAQSGVKQLDYLPQLNQGDAYGLFTIPLFDIYWQHRQQTYLGVEHPGGSPRPSRKNDGVTLAYFSMSIENARIVDGLIESALPIIAYLGQLAPSLRARLQNTNVTLVDKPFQLAAELPGRALAVHAGSLGMSAAAVYAGIPQVGLFQHDEGMSNCRSFAIAQIGNSMWAAKSKPKDIARLMHEAKNSTTMRNYALALSERYAEFRDSNPMEKAARIAMQLLA